ncbi:efflux RND transporter periplasmic adaptor subunit [Limnobacter parvus]|uniref:Efflux RND transporter periplasmic adaptor subunit n=1 Tax=Limnobacter parvus TaxID=2939690 RepID=A0ABT1XKL2_9BURK|nr:efflux RND transporter periplasmic adaptor subunit [Limnobacter parvus]MCR2747825.1 efflux RND transporter periplasmic adaptor subunit [Limnobacter parvus]
MIYKRNSALCISALLTVGSLSLAGCGSQEGGANAAASPTLPQVRVLEVTAKPVSLFTELPGRTSPYLIAEVRPQVNGIIKARQFQEGSKVKAGMSLYQIDPSTYQAEYASAKAMLEKAQASLTSATIRNDRFQELAKQNAVSQQERDDAFATLKLAQADVAASKAALQSAQINLTYTRVTAPISGQIGRSNITAGALVQQGQTNPLTTIHQLDPIYVDLTQSTTELLQLKRDLESGVLKSAGKDAATVTLKLEDGSDYAQTGKLQFSDVTVDQNTGTVTLRAVFPNPDQQLLPGMYVRASLEEGVREASILVPQKAIMRDATGEPSAFVLTAENKVEKRSVKTARAIGDQWLIAEGLQAGDRLIVDGIQKVRPGEEAEIISDTENK